MSDRVKCSKCGKDYSSEVTYRAHMSSQHGGYSSEDLKASGVKPNRRDIARQLAGDDSSKSVSNAAPDSEPKIGEDGPKRTRRSKQTEDPEIQAAKDNILRARCLRAASLPYTLLGGLLGEPDIKLSKEEAAQLTESYFTLAKAKGWEGASMWILYTDVIICHAAIVSVKERRDAFGRVIGTPTNPNEPQETEEVIPE